MCICHSETGVLNDIQIKELIDDEFILNFEKKKVIDRDMYEDIDGSSLDLHITNEIWEFNYTEKLYKGIQVSDLTKKATPFNINNILLKNHIYIIKLKEKIDFGKYNGKYGFYGVTSGRSSIGRLDVLTRLVVDNYPKYDEIPPDYRGDLYLEVIPLSFNIRLKENYRLNQLRVFHGHPYLSLIKENELKDYAPMLYIEKGNPILHDFNILRVNLKEDKTTKGDPISYRAMKSDELTLDLTKDLNKKEFLNPVTFWIQEKKIEEDDFLIMKEGNFYILRSYERMLLPNDIAVTCIAYTENLGELRIHYAGFAHPNFGHHDNSRNIGAPLIFEARCHSFNVKIRHKEQFARIEYYKMSESTESTSKYSSQELTLSRIFADW
jgi:dCTP deaminase